MYGVHTYVQHLHLSWKFSVLSGLWDSVTTLFIMKVENTETSISMFFHKYHSFFLLPKYRLHKQYGTISDAVLPRVSFHRINHL